MKTALLFTPHTGSLWPYLGCPSLTAYLQQHGLPVVQRDLNVEYYKTFLTAGYLTQCLDRIQAQLQILERQDVLADIDAVDQYQTLKLQASRASYVIQNIERAVQILKDPKESLFSDHEFRGYREVISENSKWANSIVFGGAFRLISAAHYPTQITYNTLRMRYSCFNAFDIREAAMSHQENPFLQWYEDVAMPWLKAENPGLVGMSISLYTQLIPAMTLARLIKEWNPAVHIVMGGEIITKCAKNLLNDDCKGLFDWVDSFVVNEGEKPLLDLVTALQTPEKDLTKIPSLIHKQGDRVVANWAEARVPMNSLPTPSYDGIDFENYLTPVKKVSMRISRGCYWAKCTFCTYDDMLGPVGFNVRDAEKIGEDMTTIQKKYGVQHVYFVDEAIPPKSLRTLSNWLIRQDAHMTWEGLIRFEKTFDYALLSRMREAGCVKMVFGLESVNPRVSALMQKGNDVKIVRRILRDTKRLGIVSHMGIIVGFPTEQPAEAQETFDFVKNNIDCFYGKPMFWHFEMETNSPVYQRPKDFGIARVWPKDDRPGNFDYTWNYEVTEGLQMVDSRKLHHEFLRKGERLFMERHYPVQQDGDATVERVYADTTEVSMPGFVQCLNYRFDPMECRATMDQDYQANREKYLISDSTEAPISNPYRWHNAPANIEAKDISFFVHQKSGQIQRVGAMGEFFAERLAQGPATLHTLMEGLAKEAGLEKEKIRIPVMRLIGTLIQGGFLLVESGGMVQRDVQEAATPPQRQPLPAVS